MSAVAEGRGLLAAALARVEGFLLEPAGPGREERSPAPSLRRPVIAVFGLARRCGATTVARALAAELAARDGGAAAVSSPVTAAGVPLARALADVPHARTRAVGRLCLVEGPSPLDLSDALRLEAPLVLDAGSEQVGGAAAAVADH